MLIQADGNLVARTIRENLKEKINIINKKPIFTIIYIGSDPVIDNFIKYKKRFGEYIGVEVFVSSIDEDVSEDYIIESIQKVSKGSDGVIVQLPLPKKYNQERIINSIPANKDVDVLGSQARKLFSESKSNFFPPVTGAIVQFLDYYNLDLKDKNIILVGNGTLVGYPTSLWLDREGYDYIIIDESTDKNEKKRLLRGADVIISGAGAPGLVTMDMVSEGVIIFDGGTSESGKKIIGDIHPDCFTKASFITPVPGGIGPLTIAILYTNIIHSFLKNYAQ
jgi:methylenetetrahydrofolate dehydrogenase (NADP+)/methenyltetrahydrofolate cyclohydrolase